MVTSNAIRIQVLSEARSHFDDHVEGLEEKLGNLDAGFVRGDDLGHGDKVFDSDDSLEGGFFCRSFAFALIIRLLLARIRRRRRCVTSGVAA